MITALGERVYPSGGAPELFSIGQGLGRIPRFAGHTRELYPVLAHVQVVAAIMEPKLGLYGLLHDSQETCMGDVPTPWKTVAARRREEMLQRRIYQKHGIPWPIPDEAQDAVELADRMALAAEAHVIGHPAASEFWPVYDEYTAELTRAQLKVCRDYLEPSVSGPLYERLFSEYLAASGITQALTTIS